MYYIYNTRVICKKTSKVLARQQHQASIKKKTLNAEKSEMDRPRCSMCISPKLRKKQTNNVFDYGTHTQTMSKTENMNIEHFSVPEKKIVILSLHRLVLTLVQKHLFSSRFFGFFYSKYRYLFHSPYDVIWFPC